VMLYKYRGLNNLGLRLLSNGELYFSSPDKLNDPLDCGFYPAAVRAAVERDAEDGGREKLVEMLSRQIDDKITGDTARILEAVENRVKKAGVLSFSLTATEPLMWSHYADGHAGICVGIDKVWFDDFIEREWKPNKLIGGAQVSYKEQPDFHEVVARYAKREAGGREIITDHMFVDIVMPVLRTKSEHWRYEQEYRIIRREPGVVSIPGEAIKEVIVGKRISEGDYALVQAVLSKSSLSHVRVGRAEFAENSFLMDIQYV
jgi:hypothetical protein